MMKSPDDDPYVPPNGEVSAPKRENHPPIRVSGKTRAQQAFQRCVVLFVALVVGPFLLARWPAVLCGFALPALVAWVWVANGVYRVWNDPDALAMRRSAVGVLAVTGYVLYAWGRAVVGWLSGTLQPKVRGDFKTMNAPDDDPYVPPKGVIVPRRNAGGRTRAQRAFDGCMILFGVLLVVSVPVARWTAVLGWLALPAAAGWLWCAGRVFRAWGDADARVLRWSSMGVLFFAGMMVSAMGAAFLGLFSGRG